MSSSNNKYDLDLKLLGDLADIFDSLLPVVEYAKKTKTNLRGRGVDKISKDIYRIVSNCVQKKARIINSCSKISGISHLQYLKTSTDANERRIHLQKRPLIHRTPLPPTKKLQSSILIHPQQRKTVTPPLSSPPLLSVLPPPPGDNYYTPREICKFLLTESKKNVYPLYKLIDLAVDNQFLPVSKKRLHAIFKKFKDTNGQCREVWSHFERRCFQQRRQLIHSK